MKHLMVISILFLVLVGCTGTDATSSPAQETEWAVPPSYTSHTDNTGLFTISYPGNWEAIPNPTGVDESEMENLIEKINSGNLDDAGPVFFWGFPSDNGFNPTCSLVVEPRGKSQRDIQQIMEDSISLMNDFWGGIQQISLEYEVIDGREIAVLEYLATISEVEVHSLVLVTIDKDVIWTNGCVVRLASVEYRWFEIPLNKIVRSLEIHP
jgi:hypothetical protein